MGKAIGSMVAKMGDPGVIGLALLCGLGLFVCFLGYRYFRFAAGAFGFVLGTEVVGRVCMHQGWSDLTTTILGVLSGAVVAAIFVVYVFLAVFGLGAVLWATFVGLASGSSDPRLLSLMLAALIGGFGSLFIRQFVAIVGTSFCGGLAGMGALFALVKGRSMRSALISIVPGSGQERDMFLLCVAALVTAGMVLQFRFGKNARVDGK